MRLSLQRRQLVVAYAFMGIPLLFTVVFIYYPVVVNFVLSFFEYDVVSDPVFIGLENYRRALADPLVLNALVNSFSYLLIVPVIQLAAFGMALLVNQKLRGVSLFRSLYFFPVVTPMVVISLIWTWVYQSDGILNYLLQAAHLIDRPILFLAHPDIVLFSVMFVTFWTGIGYYMMIYLAGLQGVPEEFIEAARLDGAGPIRMFTQILLPLMRPYVLFCSIMSTIGALSVFTEIYAVTGGGPAHSSETMGILMYKTAFESLEFGYAAVQSIVVTLAILLVTGINIYVQRSGGLEGY